MVRSYLIVISGQDKPGITRRILQSLPATDYVLDVQQILSKGMLTLHVLISSSMEIDSVQDTLTRNLRTFNVDVSIHDATNTLADEPQDHLIVTIMSQNLRVEDLSLITDSILALGCNIDTIERIATYPITAIELRVSRGNIHQLRYKLSEIAISHHFDLAVQRGSLQRRGKHLIVLDVDSTLIQEEVIDLLANSVGCGSEVSAITEQAMRGDIDFETSLRQRVELLTGMPVSKLAEIFSSITLSPGAKTLIRVLKYLNYNVAFVSGGFDFVVKRLAEDLGADRFVANTLEIVDEKLTGKLLGPVVDRKHKAYALKDFARQFSIPIERTIAIGDGANDIDMLNDAGLGIAFNAKPSVREQADTSINVPYLDSILYLLGITRLEIEQLNRELGINSYPNEKGL